jgi:ABC-type transport system involved in Fe-S cluster assembly fused permease/ATPase subunit
MESQCLGFPLAALKYAHIASIGLCLIPLLQPSNQTIISRKIHSRWPIMFGSCLIHLLSYTTIHSNSLHDKVHVILLTSLWAILTSSLKTETKLASLITHPSISIGFLIESLICVFEVAFLEPFSIPFMIQSLRAFTALILLVTSHPLFSFYPKKSSTDDDDRYDYSWIIGLYRTLPQVVRLLWPRDDIKIQFAYLTLFSFVLLERAMFILSSRQLGFILEKLSIDHTVVPWFDVFLWIIYSLLSSWNGNRAVQRIARTMIDNYSDARMYYLTFTHFMSLSMDFHTNKKTGEVVESFRSYRTLNRLMSGFLVSQCAQYFDIILAIVWIPKQFGLVPSVMLLCLSTLSLWITSALNSWTKQEHDTARDKAKEGSQILHESMFHWETIINFNRFHDTRDQYMSTIKASKSTDLGAVIALYYTMINRIFQQATVLSAAIITAMLEVKSGRLPVGNTVTVLMYWDHLIRPLRQLTSSNSDMSTVVAMCEGLLKLLSQTPSIIEADDASEIPSKHSCKVVFEDVEFGYDSRLKVLMNVDFVVEPGSTVALVGETGGGKSTVFKLLFRHYDVTGGLITINGQDLRKTTFSSLRDVLGLVPQNPKLFNTSILENVRYARSSATDEEVYTSCKAAAIHEKITSFPDGYQSIVGEGGVKLSGGELQRIAIARILLKDPKIVLLDEATSSVDSLTESHIQDAFEVLSGRTIIVIAHRLSTITGADLILVMDKGKVIERGSHKELLEKKGKYYSMWSKQVGSS